MNTKPCMSSQNKRIIILIYTKDCSDTEGYKNQTNFVAQKMTASEILSAQCISRTSFFNCLLSISIFSNIYHLSNFWFLLYQVDLGRTITVTGIATQGLLSYINPSYVVKYEVEYKQYSVYWMKYYPFSRKYGNTQVK